VTPTLPRVGEDFAGYGLRSVIGRGGMSVVYEAENPRLGSTIALKVLAPELCLDDVFRARFIKESRIAASLNHPNVIPIYDTGPFEELLYIAMRYVSGSDLRTVLRSGEHISPGQSLLLISQAGRALDAAHRHSLVHRDVKPANMLIERPAEDDPDHLYLADFGITKHTLSQSGLTATGQFVGTIDYIAPEQIQGKAVDGRTDIYSLGCVMYECLTGQVPFVKDVDAAVIWAHVEELPTPPSTVRRDLPKAIDEVMVRALAKDPEDRYETCRDFVAAARGALEPAIEASSAGAGAIASPPTVLTVGPTAELAPQQDAAARETRAPAGAAETPASTRPPASPPPPPPASEAPPAASAPQTTQSPSSPPSSRRPPRRGLLRVAALIVVAAIAGGLAAALSGGGKAKPAALGGEARATTLAPVPANKVSGAGSATLRLYANSALVTVTAHGLVEGGVHFMHIHAGKLGVCPPESAARLHNGHLAISTLNGEPYYGYVQASLTLSGDTSPNSFTDAARFPKTGTINYRREIPIGTKLAEEIRANRAVAVVHGIDYDGSGTYSNILSGSELLPTEPATLTAPALCGSLLPAPAASSSASAGKRQSRGGVLYAAALHVDTNPLDQWCESAPPTVAPRRRDATA
jgi:serine/threonine protein kinase